jgi:hypothetical protein
VAVERTHVTGKPVDNIIRLKGISEVVTTANAGPSSPILITLMMEAISSSEPFFRNV